MERSGLGPARAQREIEVQTAVDEARLVGRLEAALGPEFAGLWLEPSTATLHVGVVSEKARETVAAVAGDAGLADSVVEAPFQRTWAQLSAVQGSWNRRLADLIAAGKATTAVDPDTNSVKVELASTVPAAESTALTQEAAGESAVEMVSTNYSDFGIEPLARCGAFAKGTAYCNKPIVAGVSIEDNEGARRCSSGPAVIADPLKPDTTETFILTAGHCIAAAGQGWKSWMKGAAAGESKALGDAVIELEGSERVDAGAIKIENTEWTNAGQTPVPPTVANWEAGESEPVTVAGQQEPVVNHTTCFSGQTTGTQCGKIIGIGKEIGEEEQFVEVDELTKPADDGDSGGPFFAKEAAGWKMEGILFGNKKVGGVETKIALFEPLKFVFERLAEEGHPYTLLTTANQTRPKCPMPGTKCFEADTYPATVTASQTGAHAFGFESLSVSCATATFSATLTEGSETMEGAPAYGSCTSGALAETIDINECKYKFKPTVKEEEDKYKGTVDIVCPVGKSITVTSPCGCTVTIGSQAALGTVEYVDDTASSPDKDVNMKLTITGLTYTEGAGCKTPGTRANGTYNGEMTVTADEAGAGTQDFWVGG
jgi:hypothetical protein